MEVTFTIKMNAQEVQRAIENGILSQLTQGAIAQEELDAKREEIKATKEPGEPGASEPAAPEVEVGALEDVRAAFVEKNSKANSAKLKAILEEHGVNKVSDLKPDQYASVLAALEAI